jgi:DNA invertase Pin-like site-specific DNA recombinase
VRVVAVSQGIDSQNEQADVLVAVHGLMDSLYVKELAKKIHRGMEGNLLRGHHTGGSCFGYVAVEVDGGKQLRVEQEEAIVVRRIFEMSAGGAALKTIAKTLNAERIPSPVLATGGLLADGAQPGFAKCCTTNATSAGWYGTAANL